MKKTAFYLLTLVFALTLTSSGCEGRETVSDTGIKKTSANIKVGADGLTVEQRNVKKRLEVDNQIGAIKHLYVISAMSGQVIIYSTVDGKVTSGGKRLTPTTVDTDDCMSMPIDIGGTVYRTGEVLGDDGTYGSSMNYLYWWDVNGIYHQHYVTGGQIVHVSTEAMPVSDITINLSK
jgi:hypothetical protein